MSKLEKIKKYIGKELTTDEIAFFENTRKEIIDYVERMDYKSKKGHILLKWGTLKSWEIKTDKGKELLKEYGNIGSSGSAMLQKDTDKQKEIICKLIDECQGVIQEDWNGKYLTKKEAKEYVTSYNV